MKISASAQENHGSLLTTRVALASGGGSVAGSDAEVSLATGRGPDQGGQATKGVWGMSGRQEAMKGVEDCDKLGGVVKRALIPRCPN